MSTYNSISSRTYNYAMPVMSNEEWDKILSNVSIVSFMQGYSCGLKTYNNYKIVSSTNNEISVQPDYIFYVDKDSFNNEDSEYHKIDCPKLYNSAPNEFIAFTSKEVKYDKIYDKEDAILPYKYDHRNLACYDCINDGNYEKVDIFNEEVKDEATKSLRMAYYIGIAKCRNNLYKMNAVQNSQGYEVIYVYDEMKKSPKVNKTTSLPESSIKSMEILMKPTINYDMSYEEVKIGDATSVFGDKTYPIHYNSSQMYTITVDVSSKKTESLEKFHINFYDVSSNEKLDNEKNDSLRGAIMAVKVIYK